MKIRTNLKEIATDYLRACRIVPALIEASQEPPEYFYRNLGISKTTYYSRLKQNDWLPGELIILGELLET